MHEALLSAFPSRGKFAMMLGQRFDVLYADLAPESSRDVEYWTIVEQVEAEGWLPQLARATFETVPQNPRAGMLAVGLGLTSLAGTASQPPGSAPGPVSAPVLERMVRDGALLLDLPAFLARLAVLEGQVCRVEAPEGTALGTGFLVGPDMVMTNQHVIAELIGSGTRAVCRFDYLSDKDGIAVRAGVVVPFATDWNVLSVAHDPADVSIDETDPPAPDRLDTAVVRLAIAAGRAPRQGSAGPENPPRGWVGIDPAGTVGLGDDVFILQHPLGAPLKLGLGRISALPWGGLRQRYDATTETGSSGSPVLNRDLHLVGLHHVGDPNAFRTAAFNQAVPMASILPWMAGTLPEPHFWDERP